MRSSPLTLVALAAATAAALGMPRAARAQDAAVCEDAAPPARAAAPADLTVRFRDRRIDLGPYFQGFPYLRFQAEYDANALLYFRDTPAGRELRTLALDAPALDLAEGRRLGTVDWNTRGLRDVEYHAPTRQYVVVADEANEERYNLYAMSPETGALERLTDRPYIYGQGLDKQNRFVGYVPRYGSGQPFRSCLNLLEVETRQDREIVCDAPELTYTWTEVNFRPDGTGVVLAALRGGDRSHQNLVYVDLAGTGGARQRLLTDPAVRRRNVGTEREWLDNNRFLYTSDESGFTNVYVYDLAAGASRQLTQLTADDVDGLVGLRVGDRYVAAVMVKRPHESELLLVDAETGAVLGRRTFDAAVSFLDYDGNRALVQSQSRRTRFALDELVVDPAPDGAGVALAVRPRAGVPPEVAARIEQCEVERVAIPTFDLDPRTGRTRTLHAYLQTPRNPPRAPGRRFALIEAFYGGENEFDTPSQIYCEAGGIVLSPAVRGSAGFGAEFAALNDRDLGGNEILDLIYAGRFLTARFGLTERQVGLFGGSHGGYAVMRALTLPDEVNGRRERFEWGFGVSFFGFSNILTFYETCNIPDWVLLEAGDPRTERDKLLDRSPVTHAARAVAPMLLLHGENDNRVPVRESRQMAAALRRAGRAVTYVEFAGQGHGLKGLANQHRVWTETFAFLERVLGGGPTVVAPAPRRSRRPWLLGGSAVVLGLLLAAGTWAGRER